MLKLRRLLSLLIICSAVLVSRALAQSNLTLVQDTVTNPDGSLFNGSVVITFNGFASPGAIAPQSTSAQIYNGALSVLLVPSTTASPGAYYQAVYNSSNGLVTWTETWSVPPSTTPLTLSQIRTSTTLSGGGSSGGSGGGSSGGSSGTGSGAVSLPINITDVTNLSSTLASISSSIAGLTNTTNALSNTSSSETSTLATLTTTVNGLNTNVSGLGTTVTGLSSTVAGLSNTVTGLGNTVTTMGATVSSLSSQVDAITAGTTTADFADSETPAGTLDGTNAIFTLGAIPTPAASLQLFRNGLAQMSGIDFSLAGNVITFLNNNVPKPSDILQAFYRTIGTGQTATFSDAEVPSGAVNGTNASFTLAATPNPPLSLRLFKNGLLLQQNGDYTLSGATITFTTPIVIPQPGDSIVAYYRH